MTNYKVSTKIKTLSVEKVVPAHLLKQGFNWVVYEYSAKTGMLQNAYWLADYPDFKNVAPLLAHAKQNCLLNTHVCISGSTVSTAEVIATAQIECGEYVSQIPPTTTTDNKTVATGEQVGVVDSVGDALSFVLPVQNKVLKNVSFVRLDHDVIATWNAFACVAFYKFPIEYFSYLEDFKTWHKFIRFIEDKATDVSQAETIKHFVRSVLYPQNSLSCQDFDNINDALLCAMRQMPHRFQELQAIQSKILSVFPFLPEYSDTVLDDDIPPIFAESGIFDKAE